MLMIKLIKTNISKVKFHGKQSQSLSPKNLSKINNTIQYKVNSTEDKENEVDMEVSSQTEAKDEKTWESYYSKGNAEPITKTCIRRS